MDVAGHGGAAALDRAELQFAHLRQAAAELQGLRERSQD